MCVGTTSGRLLLLDMRFHVAVNTVTHPEQRCVARVWSSSARAGRVWAAVTGNGEVAEYSMDTGQRHSLLWPRADRAPPLTYSRTHNLTITGAHHFSGVHGDVLVTGDSFGMLCGMIEI